MKINPIKIIYKTKLHINTDVCLTICPFDKKQKLYAASHHCLNSCKHLILHNEVDKIIYCHKFYNKNKRYHYFIEELKQ